MILDIKIDAEGDGAWPDLDKATARRGVLTHVSALPAGMVGGRPSVAFRIKLEDGTEVFAETSMRLFQMAAAAFLGRYGIVD